MTLSIEIEADISALRRRILVRTERRARAAVVIPSLGAHFTIQLTVLEDHKLITSGPYAYVRHPSYTALILNVLGVFLCEASAGSWWIEERVFHTALGKCIALFAACTAVYFVGVVSRAPAEDRMMHKTFGKRWEDWRAEVTWMYIPGIL